MPVNDKGCAQNDRGRAQRGMQWVQNDKERVSLEVLKLTGVSNYMQRLINSATSMATPTQAPSIRLFRAWPFVAMIVLMAALACSSASPTSTALPLGPAYSAIIVPTDLTLGENRMVFGLLDRDGMPLRTDEAVVETIYLSSGESEGSVRETVTARFVEWPVGEQGVYLAKLNFNQPGECTAQSGGCWELRVRTIGPGGVPVTAVGNFAVRAQSATPGIGNPAPASVTPKGADVEDLTTITSSVTPDPDLYRLSVHEALAEDKPFVVVFATPAFCRTAICGPQVEVLSQLKERFPDDANFIHVEVYVDPHLIEGSRPDGGFVPSVIEWNLPTEPWTFIVNKDGQIHSKFEAFSTLEELEESLQELISG